MKRSFSGSQRSPLYVMIAALALWMAVLPVIALAAPEQMNVLFFAIAAVIAAPCIILLIRWHYLWNPVILDDEGIRIAGRNGKGKNEIRWSEVCLFTVTKNEQDGERYVCLSSNARLPFSRTTFGGVYYTMFYEPRGTYVLRCDDELLMYCEEKLEPYGVEAEYVVNPNTGK